MIRLLLILSLFLLPACTLALAQDDGFPPPPVFYLSPGLERPNDSVVPNPYIKLNWTPPNLDDIEMPEYRDGELFEEARYTVSLEIYDENGRTRDHLTHVTNAELLNVFSSGGMGAESRKLKNAGCTLEESNVRITRECLNRFDPQFHGRVSGAFPRDFLKPGKRYEVRIAVWYYYWTSNPNGRGSGRPFSTAGEEHFSPVQHLTIPRPERSTPTLQPTLPCSAQPTREPCSTAAACPAAPTPMPSATPIPCPRCLACPSAGSNPYDTNGNGLIDMGELFEVINDYFGNGQWRTE